MTPSTGRRYCGISYLTVRLDFSLRTTARASTEWTVTFGKHLASYGLTKQRCLGTVPLLDHLDDATCPRINNDGFADDHDATIKARSEVERDIVVGYALLWEDISRGDPPNER
jgi:hypothetical protein